MNYSPDYHMRRRNHECACNRPYAPVPMNRGLSGSMPISEPVSDCGCNEAIMDSASDCRRNCSMSEGDGMDSFAPGMAYVPWQKWQELYDVEKGLQIGTVFSELDYPWMIGRCVK